MTRKILIALFAFSTLFVCMGQDCFLAGWGDGLVVIGD